MHYVSRALARRLTRLLLLLLPPRPLVVAYGMPDSEANVVEMIRWLLEHDDRRIVWLTADGDPTSVDWLLHGVRDRQRLRVLRKRSPRGFLAFLLAEQCFYSHFLYLCPPPVRGRVYVNLWHGDGPKTSATVEPGEPADSFVVASTQVWGRIKARALGLDEQRLLVVGNARRDQFARPASDEALAALGIDGSRPFAVWAPTFREATLGMRVVRDTGRLSEGGTASELSRVLSAWSASAAMQLVVKPHPLDRDAYDQFGLLVVDDAALRGAEVGIYQVLARSAALLTDYSSIWTDYLPLDRPIGFFCPDLAAYAAARGLDVDEFREYLAGPLLRDPTRLTVFCDAVAAGADPEGCCRQVVAERLGAVLDPGVPERLMAELNRRTARSA